MAITKKKLDLSIEKSILTGMIISDRFLQEIIPIYDSVYFQITFGTLIADWCMTFYDNYEKAPKETIKDLFETWSKKNAKDNQIEFVDGFLGTLSDEYEHAEKFNVEYMMDKTLEYFKTRSLRVLSDEISYCLDNNNLEDAEDELNKFRKVEKDTISGVDVFDDEDAWREAFNTNTETLFTVPGRLGELLNGQFTRDSFISLMGIAKIGKTWNLTFLAYCAILSRCNVAFFQVGDLSQGQMMLRNGIYIAKRSNKAKYCGELLLPVLDCELNQKDICHEKGRTCDCGVYDEDSQIMEFDDAPKDYVPCTYCQGKHGKFKGTVWHEKRRPVRPLTWQEAYNAARDYKRKHRAKRYKLSTHSTKSINVAGIVAKLDTWERVEGWIPDVIIIDYADILASEGRNKEERDNINETWIALRGLSQQRHCCVITATQANGAAINQKTVSREHYSSDRRKFDHVTAMFGLSQTNEEKRKGVTRWGALVLREDDWDPDHTISVLGSLSIGRPYLDSF
jgi:replicative DNA helicase